MNLQIGQTYKIKFKREKVSTDAGAIIQTRAKLIQKTSFFYVFEYKSKGGDLLRASIDKFDLNKNPSLILEV